jgi:hypothetical protein
MKKNPPQHQDIYAEKLKTATNKRAPDNQSEGDRYFLLMATQ